MLHDVDEVLTTTRSVRLRLDLERPVPDQVILDCIDLAEQAPTGGNQSSRRWLVVRDPARKEALAELYREAGGDWIIESADRLAGRAIPTRRSPARPPTWPATSARSPPSSSRRSGAPTTAAAGRACSTR